jgi:hypothetical protein
VALLSILQTTPFFRMFARKRRVVESLPDQPK